MYMDRDATAPALGGITKRREKKWLYQYTKNSFEMYRNGDSIALDLRNQGWALMTSFPDMKDSELDAIYYFIEKRYEMTMQGIPIPVYFEFKMSENKRAMACKHVLNLERDILKASVSEDRSWLFHCGSEYHEKKDWQKTTLKTLFDLDHSINAVSYTTHEFPAKRTSKDSDWELDRD